MSAITAPIGIEIFSADLRDMPMETIAAECAAALDLCPKMTAPPL